MKRLLQMAFLVSYEAARDCPKSSPYLTAYLIYPNLNPNYLIPE